MTVYQRAQECGSDHQKRLLEEAQRQGSQVWRLKVLIFPMRLARALNVMTSQDDSVTYSYVMWAEPAGTPKMEPGVSGLTKFGFHESPIRRKPYRKFPITIEGRMEWQPQFVSMIVYIATIPIRKNGV